MHGPTQERLEELLAGKPTLQPGLEAHLAACAGCSSDLDAMRRQAAMVRELRAPEDLEPAPGFYARVRQRIEERGVQSVWSVFIDTPFGKHIAFASLALALVLGSWVIGLERNDGHLSLGPVVTADASAGLPVMGDRQQQRDLVLVNLASYEEPPAQ